MVKEISDEDGAVRITLRLTSPICWQAANIVAMVEEKVGAVAGVSSIECKLDHASEWMPDMMSAHAQARLRQVRPFPARV
jgi:metal-sulfur cluster biosynthetic enzyme